MALITEIYLVTSWVHNLPEDYENVRECTKYQNVWTVRNIISAKYTSNKSSCDVNAMLDVNRFKVIIIN